MMLPTSWPWRCEALWKEPTWVDELSEWIAVRRRCDISTERGSGSDCRDIHRTRTAHRRPRSCCRTTPSRCSAYSWGRSRGPDDSIGTTRPAWRMAALSTVDQLPTYNNNYSLCVRINIRRERTRMKRNKRITYLRQLLSELKGRSHNVRHRTMPSGIVPCRTLCERPFKSVRRQYWNQLQDNAAACSSAETMTLLNEDLKLFVL